MNYEKLDALVASYKDELIEDIRRWVRVPSVLAPAAAPDMPFGEVNRKMLDMALEDAARFGFAVRNVDGYAGDISMGDGEKTLGMLCHLDVVPAGDGWKHDPWGGEVENGRIYGRGTMDDKGPALVALYAMRAVKEAGIPLVDGVRLILGCDEETGMTDMRHYASVYKMPDYGFSPDAAFPVINIEKGGINLELGKLTDGEKNAYIPVYSLYAGERPNVVPAVARAEVGTENLSVEALKEKLDAVAAEDAEFKYDIQPGEEGRAVITAYGVNAHGSTPELGLNAASKLLIALKKLGAGGGSKIAIEKLADTVAVDHVGEALGVASSDEESGALSCNLGILRYDGYELTAMLDMRVPVCGDHAKIIGQAALAVRSAGMTVRCAGDHTPHYVSKEHKIVRGLCKVYSEVTGREGYAYAIGGGTYSRMMPNTVAFGMAFPDEEDMCHMPDESIDIENTMLSLKVFAHAIADLAGGVIEE